MSAITTNYDNSVYATDPGLYSYGSAAASGETDFGAVLSSQLAAEDQSTASDSSAATTSADQLALTSYDPGQVTAYALSQSSEEAASESAAETEAASQTEAAEETSVASVSEESSSEETAEAEVSEEAASAGGSGWPGGAVAMNEWTPSGMQFYDEMTGQWVDDNIPHRINESGDLEYYWEGQWYLDTAVRHRMDGDEQSEVASLEGEETGLEAEGEVMASLASDGPFLAEYYYNADLGQWKLFNFPTRENEDGTTDYYWQDQWWTDEWNHDYTAGETSLA